MKNPEIDLEGFCYYPFAQMLLQPTGAVSPCCWNQQYSLGNVPEQTLEQIWNGEPAQNLRREFLEGKPRSCKTQMDHIGCHRYSRRDFSDLFELKVKQSAGPRRLDLRLNGKCNLECVMCDVWSQPNGIYDESSFWKNGPTEIFPHLLEIDLLGGEPFVQADTFRLIHEVSQVNPKCTWAFVTNGHYRFADKIHETLDKVSIRWIQVSLDSLNPETYKKIRVRGDLNKPLATIEDLFTYQKSRMVNGSTFRLLISICVQKDNWREIEAFIEYTRARNANLELQFAYHPESVSLLNLSAPERREVIRYLKSLIPRFGASLVQPILRPLQDATPGFFGSLKRMLK
jgi:MoaA/NifB/PqqE/SkfB family radical SAM enzyme